MFARAVMTASLVVAAFVLPASVQAADSVARTDVNMRSGPGTSYDRIAVVPAGARVRVLECGGWCRVTYGGRTGWVSASYIGSGRTSARSSGWTDIDLPGPDAYNPLWDNDWNYYRYPYGEWYTYPGGYWWVSPGAIFRF